MNPDGLSPTTRALLDAARAELSPDADALSRVRARVDAAVAAGAGGASAAGGIALKLSLLSGVMALVLGAGIYALHDTATMAKPHPRAVAVEPRATAEPAALVVPPREVVAEHIEMPPVRVRSPRAAAVPRPERIELLPEPAPPPRRTSLAREVELVDAAMAALRRGAADAALGHVRQHREETRDRGQLAEEAAAIEIEALCALHDRRAEPKLAAFDGRWPSSAQRARLTTACP